MASLASLKKLNLDIMFHLFGTSSDFLSKFWIGLNIKKGVFFVFEVFCDGNKLFGLSSFGY